MSKAGWPFALASAAILSFALPAAASSQDQGASPDPLHQVRAILHQRQEAEQRLDDIGWRLVTGNALYCENAKPAIGLKLHDMAGYARPDLAQASLGLETDFAIHTVAKTSPAAIAGLKRNQPIAHIAGAALDTWPARGGSDWERLERAHDLIEGTLAQTGKVELGLSGTNAITLSGVPACPSRLEIAGAGKRAFADGKRLRFERDFPAFQYDDDELAAAIAHELAHNLLRHPQWLEMQGRSTRNIRRTEREADRLIPWLLANAGYDPSAAARYMRRWGPEHGSGIFRKRTHDRWNDRAQRIDTEYAVVEQLWDETGAADWRVHFRRDTGD